MILMLLLLLSGNVWAAASSGNENHVDTQDYCLRADDVTIGLTEIQECGTPEEIQAHILEAAKITIRVRDHHTNALSDPVGPESYTVDFSGFIPEADGSGYPVTVTADSITEEPESAVTFLVTVVDDLPKQRNARVRFFGTQIPDLVLDITTGDYSLHISELDAPQKEGHTFLGWYLDETGTQPYLLADSQEYESQRIGADTTLYPVWKKIEITEPIIPTPIEPTPTEPPPTEPPPTESTPTNPMITEPTKAETEPQTTMPETTIVERPKQASGGTGAVAVVPSGTEMPTPTPSPEVTEPETTEVPEPVTDTAKTVPQQENKVETAKEGQEKGAQMQKTTVVQESGITGIAYGAVGTCIAALLVLGAGILSDLRVLRWYASKGPGG